MAEKDPKQGRGFKVIDRRGEEREEETPAEAPAQATPPPSSDSGMPESGEAHDLPTMDFSTFVVSLATSALYHMGLVEDPETGQTAPPNLPLARQTVDTLAILEEKTVGNLEPEEARLLQSLLYDLRMHFVQVGR